MTSPCHHGFRVHSFLVHKNVLHFNFVGAKVCDYSLIYIHPLPWLGLHSIGTDPGLQFGGKAGETGCNDVTLFKTLVCRRSSPPPSAAHDNEGQGSRT